MSASANAKIGPKSIIGPESEIGEGSEIGADTTVGRFVAIEKNVRVGDNVTVQAGTAIGQDTTIAVEDHDGPRPPTEIKLGASISSDCEIQSGSTIGVYTKVKEDVQVGADARVGDGCVLEKGCEVEQGAKVQDAVTVKSDAKVRSGEVVPRDTALDAPGSMVVYKRTGKRGVVTSSNDHYVFVLYGSDMQSKATKRGDLQPSPGRRMGVLSTRESAGCRCLTDDGTAGASSPATKSRRKAPTTT